jgi:dTMP kinase
MTVRRLARAWALQGVTWYGLTEVALRIVLEGALVLALALAGVPWPLLVAAWIAAHTLAWFVLYGGFHLAWKLAHLAAGRPRLEAHVARLRDRLPRSRAFRVVLLRGGFARGDVDDRSDIDLVLVPHARIGSKVLGVLRMWSLRVDAIAHRVPVEVRWLDAERYVPYHMAGETPIVLSDRPPRPEGVGTLLTFSGIDGSGKTTIAKRVVASLLAARVDVVRLWAHRQAWFKPTKGPDWGLAVMFESYWKRLGRHMDELHDHHRVRFLYDVLTVADYVYVRARLLVLLRPGSVVLCDRYVADVIAYLKGWGPLHPSLEGLLVGLAREPDLAILFQLEPHRALERKAENPIEQLQGFAAEFRRLQERLRLVSVDASRPTDEVFAQVAAVLRDRLGLPVARDASPADGLVPGVRPIADIGEGA